MTRNEIDDVVREIMRRDGPDRHTDGHDIITNFIGALLAGKGHAWAAWYRAARHPMDETQPRPIWDGQP